MLFVVSLRAAWVLCIHERIVPVLQGRTFLHRDSVQVSCKHSQIGRRQTGKHSIIVVPPALGCALSIALLLEAGLGDLLVGAGLTIRSARIANPGILRKPFVWETTERTIGAAEEHRH